MTSGNKQAIFGIVVTLFAICYLALIPSQVSFEPILGAGGRDKINGAFFPVIAGTFLLLTSLILTYKAFKNKSAPDPIDKRDIGWALLLLILGFIYVYAVDKLGYIIPTMVLLGLLCCMLKQDRTSRYIFAVFPIASTLVIYFVFSKLFYVPLP